jgi:hypothetical protein
MSSSSTVFFIVRLTGSRPSAQGLFGGLQDRDLGRHVLLRPWERGGWFLQVHQDFQGRTGTCSNAIRRFSLQRGVEIRQQAASASFGGAHYIPVGFSGRNIAHDRW